MKIPQTPTYQASGAPPTSYDADFYIWTREQIALLRKGCLDKLDIENLIEEIDAMGKSDKRALMSQLSRLLQHLLKWQYQPEKRKTGNSWLVSITNSRSEIGRLIDDSPSLKNISAEDFDAAYQAGLRDAIADTWMAKIVFPKVCPWKQEDVLKENFLPGQPIEEILPDKKSTHKGARKRKR